MQDQQANSILSVTTTILAPTAFKETEFSDGNTFESHLQHQWTPA